MWRGSWKRSLKNEPSLWKNIKFYSLCRKFSEAFQKIFSRTLHLWLASVFLMDFRNWALRFFNSKNFFQILLDLIIPWCIYWCMYYSKYILLKKTQNYCIRSCFTLAITDITKYFWIIILVLRITCLRGKFGIILPSSLFWNFPKISRINMWFLVNHMWQALKEHTRVRITQKTINQYQQI